LPFQEALEELEGRLAPVLNEITVLEGFIRMDFLEVKL